MRAARPARSRGTVLILVLFIVAILSVVALSQMLLTRSEVAAAGAADRGREARAAAMSGIHRAMALLLTPPGDTETWQDNPTVFQAQEVTGQGEQGWFFTVYADNPEDPTNLRYGLEDEAGKINLNTASEEMLAALPNMTPELVDALLDYRDGDDETRPNGAEQEYYDSLPRPYQIKNGPLATVEELLLVRGFDGSIVYGEDANRNGLLEPNEDDGESSFPPDNADGQLDRGLRYLATTFSYVPNVSSEGEPRININTGDPNALTRDLQDAGFSRETVDFLVAARNARVTWTDPAELLEATLDVPDPRRAGQTRRIASGVDADGLELVMDKLTTGGARHPATGQEVLFGRVNLNTAPRQVLSALPGMDENIAQQIVDRRGGLDERQRSTTAWIFTQGVVSAEGFKKVSPLVTARSYQYRVRSFGYSTVVGRFCVLEAVIDLSAGQPRISYLRDLTRLGVPLVPTGTER